MGFIDQATKQVHGDGSFDMHRFQVGPCDVCVFVLRRASRVFIGGGRFGFDSLAREADAVEVEALAERFQLPELQAIAVRIRSLQAPTAGEVDVPPSRT